MLAPAVFVALLAPLFTAAAPLKASEADIVERSAFPFTRVVAFGDNLSDNGNGASPLLPLPHQSPLTHSIGSFAHGVTAANDPTNPVYGYGTWTNGPVAVSYLVDLLDVPLAADYAFGHADGGSLFGATINNTYDLSPAGAPSGFQQVANYTKHSDYMDDIDNTLHFVWIGNNDISLKHIYVWPGLDSINDLFASEMARQMTELVQRLVDQGAEYIFVPNLYPKNISPSNEFMTSTTAELASLTATIAAANDAIEAALEQFGDNVLYYDVNAFMTSLWNNADDYGITHVDGEFCDGYSQDDWDLCVTDGEGDTFYWMQYLDMTTYVHELIAQDMYKAIKAHF